MPQQDWLEKDFYKTLGVSEGVSEKDLTKAYRKLARTYHPDANPNNAAAENKFKEVSEAYETLKNAETRREYDEFRKYGSPLGGFGGAQQRQSSGGSGFQGGDFSDILGDILGGRGRPTSAANAPQYGEDLEASLTLGFEEAVEGITTTVHLTSDVVCSDCKGSGAAPGSAPEHCHSCHGRGVQDANQGLFSFAQPCALCNGRGMVVKNPCRTCNATGTERKPRNVKVRVPPGVKNGQRIRLKGKGAPGRRGGVAGNLFIVLHVDPHEIFGRSGSNLTLVLPLTFSEAALGGKVKVPTLGGDAITLRIPPGTSAGKIFRVKGQGVVTASKKGDLLVTIAIDVPEDLSDKQKQALQEYGDATVYSPREHLQES